MITVFYLLHNLMQQSQTVLIMGETGTGKELLGHALHYNSDRYRPGVNNFSIVDCANLPKELLASELFGYVKGAFTGADPRGKAGAFEYAKNGTVLIDEIGELPIELQVNLLRVLQEKHVKRLGSNVYTELGDVRLVLSTRRDLVQYAKEGKFRDDLLYRIVHSVVYVPTLWERGVDDFERLLKYFMDGRLQNGDLNFDLPNESMRRLYKLDFRGNIRSLEAFVNQAFAIGKGKLSVEALQKAIPYIQYLDDTLYGKLPRGNTLALPTLNLRGLERLALLEALKLTRNDKREAAKILGVADRTVYRVLEREPDLITQVNAAIEDETQVIIQRTGELEPAASLLGMSVEGLRKEVRRLKTQAQ